ncbi:hypothetical protein GcM1_185001 [Golovinomyces cichoracearum]|uniref:Gpi anchored cell wall protein n=1 Tax=Golovinomyces cichoracearum TaxID=62708 RepID=A0A420J2W9_9PEZI|nr:hypothetical protein GcM1_185001 [Golovinomyces cichoracearum]
MFIQVFMAIMAFAQVIVKATTPPACLIGALGAQPSPADFKAVCGNLQQQVISKITEKCTNATMYSAAMSAYAATCLSEASIKVEMKNDTDFKLRSTTEASDQKSPAKPVPKSDSTQSPSTVAEQPSKPPSNIANCNNPSTAVKLLTFGTIARILL